MDKTTERMIAFVKKQRAGPLLTGKITGSNFCPRFSSLLTAHLRKATGLSPYYIEKGRHAATNLDRDNILRRGDSTDPDKNEFIAGIHNIEQEVREMELTRHWMERDADKRRRNISASLRPGAYAYLSTKGISMPVDKQLSLVSFQLRPPATSRIQDVFHDSLLKPAHDSQSLGVRGTQLPVATDSVEYEVGKLLTRRGEIITYNT